MRSLAILVVIALVLGTGGASAQEDTSGIPEVLAGAYLGYAPPTLNPEPFGRGVLSSAAFLPHSAPAFSPDGQELFFSAVDRRNTQRPTAVMYMRQINSNWTPPAIASFSGVYDDDTPVFSPDGRRVYFASRRPLQGTEPQSFFDLWYLERTESGWSEPKPLGAPVNTSLSEYAPVVTGDGSLYFVATNISTTAVGFIVATVLIGLALLAVLIFRRLRRLYLALGLIAIWVLVAVGILMARGPNGFLLWMNDDIYCSRMVNGQFAQPEHLGSAVNGEYEENWFWVAPDQSWLLFYARDRKQGTGYFISYRDAAGDWTDRVRAGDLLNRLGTRPGLSPDGRYLFMVGNEGYSWLQSGIIDYVRTHDLNLIDRFIETAGAQGTDKAIEEFQQASAVFTGYDLVSEGQVNQLGYEYLRIRRDSQTARALFKLNTVLFPGSFNVWDSYAEACVEEGDTEEAIRHYRRSLQLNPANENAIDYLRQLGADTPGGGQ